MCKDLWPFIFFCSNPLEQPLPWTSSLNPVSLHCAFSSNSTKTNNRYISMAESDCYDSKLSESIYFEKSIYSHFRNLQENKNPDFQKKFFFGRIARFYDLSLTTFSNVQKISFCIVHYFLA